MARPINPKEVNTRIKANKAVMRDSKAIVSAQLTQCIKTGNIDKSLVRAAVSTFIKASEAVNIDAKKL